METFQQPKITGYRQLNEQEAALMNEIKAEGAKLALLHDKIKTYLGEQSVRANDDPTEERRLGRAEAPRWLAMGKSDLQRGLMNLTRAVAQPDAF